jgi:hypothetical protein
VPLRSKKKEIAFLNAAEEYFRDRTAARRLEDEAQYQTERRELDARYLDRIYAVTSPKRGNK